MEGRRTLLYGREGRRGELREWMLDWVRRGSQKRERVKVGARRGRVAELRIDRHSSLKGNSVAVTAPSSAPGHCRASNEENNKVSLCINEIARYDHLTRPDSN